VTAPGFDGRRDALVETPDPPALPPSTTPAVAHARRVSPTDLRVSTSTTEPRLLVVSEMYYPGWRAYVDGVETPILRTNYLFRGVVVPGGRHVVRFAYLPSSVIAGAAVSALALLAAAVLLYRSRPSAVRPAAPAAHGEG
jgi:membrane protein YfhO